ncbi:putative membrane protein [Bradyrhizobium sp. i1.7.7]
MGRHWVDITAVGFFIIEWLVYALTLEHSAYGRDSLSARMNRYREVWVRRLLDRDTRMVDMQIMASLQNGTAFFASTSLFALGGALALLHATNDAITILSKLPIDLSTSPAMWELKCVRPRADLRLRLLQIRLGLSPVQLCRDPVWRHAAG